MCTKSMGENYLGSRWVRLVGLAALGILMCQSIFTLHLLASYLLGNATPARSEIWYFAIPFGLAVTAICWRNRTRFLPSSVLRKGIVGLLLLFGLFSSYKVGDFLLHPTWEAMSISRRLSEILPDDATVAGDWAPFFALQTDFRALYMNNYFNRAERIKILRPSHFLYSGSSYDVESKHIIEEIDGVSLEAAIFQSDYNGSTVILFPISYVEDDQEMAVKVPR